jgi:hypothetical protein
LSGAHETKGRLFGGRAAVCSAARGERTQASTQTAVCSAARGERGRLFGSKGRAHAGINTAVCSAAKERAVCSAAHAGGERTQASTRTARALQKLLYCFTAVQKKTNKKKGILHFSKKCKLNWSFLFRFFVRQQGGTLSTALMLYCFTALLLYCCTAHCETDCVAALLLRAVRLTALLLYC